MKSEIFDEQLTRLRHPAINTYVDLVNERVEMGINGDLQGARDLDQPVKDAKRIIDSLRISTTTS